MVSANANSISHYGLKEMKESSFIRNEEGEQLGRYIKRFGWLLVLAGIKVRRIIAKHRS